MLRSATRRLPGCNSSCKAKKDHLNVLNTRLVRIVAVALVALLGALGVAACGDSGGGQDPNKVLKDTFSGGKKVTSGKVELLLALKTEGGRNLGGPIELKLTGPFQSQGPKQLPKFDFDLSLLAAGRSFKAGAVSVGSAGFLKFQGQAYSVPDQVFAQFKQGFERAQAKGGTGQSQTFASLGVNPRDWLKDAKDQGEQDVGGTKTIHVSAGVDVPKLLDDVNKILSKARGQLGTQSQRLPTQLTPQQRKAVQDALQNVTFDLYTGKDDKILRRMTIKLKFKVPQAQQQRAQGLTGGELTFDLVLNDLNKPQTVNPPASPRPFSELTQAARGALGGLGLGGTTGGSTGGSTTTPGAGGTGTTPGTGGTGSTGGDQAAQRYLQCLQQAAGDVAKAQKCAALLTTR
jgi:hypothetical protein